MFTIPQEVKTGQFLTRTHLETQTLMLEVESQTNSFSSKSSRKVKLTIVLVKGQLHPLPIGQTILSRTIDVIIMIDGGDGTVTVDPTDIGHLKNMVSYEMGIN